MSKNPTVVKENGKVKVYFSDEVPVEFDTVAEVQSALVQEHGSNRQQLFTLIRKKRQLELIAHDLSLIEE